MNYELSIGAVHLKGTNLRRVEIIYASETQSLPRLYCYGLPAAPFKSIIHYYWLPSIRSFLNIAFQCEGFFLFGEALDIGYDPKLQELEIVLHERRLYLKELDHAL